MSSVIIAGDTSGSVTLSAPAVSGTTTLTLPATTGTVVTKDTNGILSVNGVQFPATQSASADANCLDDYEEGTWSPSIGGTATYIIQEGRYTKVGKLVSCMIDMQILVIGTGSTSIISGFPFTNSVTVATGAVSYYAAIATATNFIAFYVTGAGASCTFVGNTGNATTVGLNGFAIFGNSARVVGSITYQTS